MRAATPAPDLPGRLLIGLTAAFVLSTLALAGRTARAESGDQPAATSTEAAEGPSRAESQDGEDDPEAGTEGAAEASPRGEAAAESGEEPEETEEAEAEGAVEIAYDRTLNYLSYRPRSRAEVERYLQKRGLSEDQIEPVVQRLARAGLLDDEAFARYWVENRERHRPRGPRALRYELRQKGVANKTIDRALASLDVLDSAYRSAGRKARQLAHLDRETFMKKLVAYLARRGFDYEIARETAGRHWAELAADE